MPIKPWAGRFRGTAPRWPHPGPRPSATAASVTRDVDGSGNVCFAATSHRAGIA